MEVEIKVVGRDNVADSDRQDVSVETHMRRGDAFSVAKVDTVREGQSVMFRVPGGARLLLVTPEGENEVVYDAAQGAAVRRSAQENDQGKADDARTGEQRQAAELGRRHDQAEGQQAPRVQTGVRPNTPQAGVRTPTPAEVAAKAEADKKAREQSEAQAKQRQQAASGSGSGINPGGTISTDNLKDQK